MQIKTKPEKNQKWDAEGVRHAGLACGTGITTAPSVTTRVRNLLI